MIMQNLNQTSTYCYDSGDPEGNIGFSGILEVFVHHARNIHNICIYDNQDVYAKFSLTYNPDETISTRAVIGGGKNPEFNEKLELKVNQNEAVLKCEIWMLSRVRNLMEDQLLGFALVSISLVANQGGKISCQDFSLSSTDLFHSPAGTVQLSVSIISSKIISSVSPLNSSRYPFSNFSGNSQITKEVILLDPNEYSRVEFPDINAAIENQMMVSEYFNLNSKSIDNHHHGSFLHLGSVLETRDDYEMAANSSEENESSPNWSNPNSGILSSTTTSLSDDRNTADSSSIDKKSHDHSPPPPALVETGEKQGKVNDGCSGDHKGERIETQGNEKKRTDYGNPGRGYSGGVGSMDIETEQTAMQQQIVDMYMKSMQQFTESLAKMKLPIGLDPNPDDKDPVNAIQIMEKNNKKEMENSNKKDGSRIFYGSRSFF